MEMALIQPSRSMMNRKLYFSQKRNYLHCILVYYFILIYLTVIGEGGIIIYDGEENIEEFSDIELSFTEPIQKYGMEGAIVSAEPADACTAIAGPPIINSSLSWFVLIAGNYCDYSTKLKNSVNAGYSAAVIYTYRGRNDGPMRRHHNFIANISGVTIRTSSGLIIKDNYLYTIDMRFWISLTPNHFNPKWHIAVTKCFILVLTLACFAIFLSVPLGIVRFVHQTTTFHDNRLSTQHLRQLQTSRFQKGDPYETCAICLEDYKAKEKLRILPCGHGYHSSCIDPWLTKNRRICPVCKARVVLAHEMSDVDSDTESRSETAPLLSNYNRSTSSSYRALSDTGNASSYNSQHTVISETTQNATASGGNRI